MFLLCVLAGRERERIEAVHPELSSRSVDLSGSIYGRQSASSSSTTPWDPDADIMRMDVPAVSPVLHHFDCPNRAIFAMGCGCICTIANWKPHGCNLTRLHLRANKACVPLTGLINNIEQTGPNNRALDVFRVPLEIQIHETCLTRMQMVVRPIQMSLK